MEKVKAPLAGGAQEKQIEPTHYTSYTQSPPAVNLLGLGYPPHDRAGLPWCWCPVTFSLCQTRREKGEPWLHKYLLL
jgi:hypothetical protein